LERLIPLGRSVRSIRRPLRSGPLRKFEIESFIRFRHIFRRAVKMQDKLPRRTALEQNRQPYDPGSGQLRYDLIFEKFRHRPIESARSEIFFEGDHVD
jgi:hypothetical protein